MKICVYAICKNESQHVERWVNSMGEADLIIVTDTGSTDNSVELLTGMGVEVHEAVIDPWRFDVARNAALSFVPDDVDICVSTDIDEVFAPGWREHLERAWDENTTRGTYWYNWGADTQFVNERIHARHGYSWKMPVHEYLHASVEENRVFIGGMVLNHCPESLKSHSDYLPLLELSVQENPACARSRHYLGREYFFRQRWGECIETLCEYLKLPTAAWEDERCHSMRLIAKAYGEMGDTANCYRWFYRAIAECPNVREPYVEFAKAAFNNSDWKKVAFLIKEALGITEMSSSYFNESFAWDDSVRDMLTQSLCNLFVEV